MSVLTESLSAIKSQVYYSALLYWTKTFVSQLITQTIKARLIPITEPTARLT